MKQITIVFAVRPLADAGEHPLYAYFHVNVSFLAKLRQLSGLLRQHDLTEVRVTSGPEYQDEELHRLDSHELVVARSLWWFRAASKSLDCDVETHPAMTVEQLHEHFHQAVDGEAVFLVPEQDLDEAREWFHEAFASFDT